MKRFYCERHQMTHHEGECDVCEMVERHTEEVAQLTASVTAIALANVEVEKAMISFAHASDELMRPNGD